MTRAAVDIGTNTVRLLVIDSEGRDLERRSAVTGLGRGVDSTRTFRGEAVMHSLAVLGEYRGAMDHHGAARIRVVATSAARDVRDGDAFLDAAEQVLGVRPEIITGEEEAALSFQGSRMRGELGEDPTLTIDVGGGSTEFVYGSESPLYLASIDIGSVRLTERTLPERPATDAQIGAARSEADRSYVEVELPGPVRTGVGVGGTFTTLSTLSRNLPYTASVHGEVLTREEVEQLVDRLTALSIEETAALDGIDPARAPVILGGAIAVERALAAARLDEVLVSEHDLLDGIAASVS